MSESNTLNGWYGAYERCTLTSEQATPKGAVTGRRGVDVRRVMVRD